MYFLKGNYFLGGGGKRHKRMKRRIYFGIVVSIYSLLSSYRFISNILMKKRFKNLKEN